MTLYSYLLISLFLFACGIIVMMSRKNIIAMLLGIELILNASAINFVAYSRFLSGNIIEGHVMSLFIIVIAAAEAAVGLGIVIRFFQLKESIHIDSASELKS